MNVIVDRIEKLRARMKEEGIDAYIIPTSDAHNSEYVGEHDQVRRWFTGFTGSNGTLVVTMQEARLWTDGRYYIQCEQEISDTGICMMKMGETGVPSVWEYIAGLNINTLGFDGRLISKHSIDELRRTISENSKFGREEIQLIVDKDIAGQIWEQSDSRPSRSCERVKLLDIGFTGKECNEKLQDIRRIMLDKKCDQLFISKLDDIMWLFNIRGGDVECNPVALSFAFINKDDAFLFIQNNALSPAVRGYLQEQRIIVCDYDDVYEFLQDYPYAGRTMIDDREISFLAYISIEKGYEGNADILHSINPTTELKAIKNETEIKWMREYFLRDSVAMTKYIYKLKEMSEAKAANEKLFDEYEAGKICDEIRLSTEGCVGLSFPTIAAYGENAAMMHYEATENKKSDCYKKGMILTDCGGQYPGATTDVTRTIALGEVTNEEKKDFTYVLKGWLALMNAKWLSGCTGRNLDILARGPLWSRGIDYKCGTGHGVGCYLNVHEGPQNIRWKYIEGASEAVLKPGMTVTDEPGVYREGRYGIRTENTLLVVEDVENSDGKFLCFENLTWVPIDKELVDAKLLNADEKKQLTNYNKMVIKKIGKYLTEDELAWLKNSI